MQVIEAPAALPESGDYRDLFLAGGITDCPDWQKEVLRKLAHTDLTILNPRRSTAFTGDIADEQIRWEYKALRAVDTVMFWFPEQTLCPISLFELGVFSQRKNTRLLVGTHPNYARRMDVQIQMELARPEVTIHSNLVTLVEDYLSQSV